MGEFRRMNIGKALEGIRHERRITKKKDFAKKLGISNSFYSEVIHGKKSINVTTLENICERLNMPLLAFVMIALYEGN